MNHYKLVITIPFNLTWEFNGENLFIYNNTHENHAPDFTTDDEDFIYERHDK